MNFKYINDLVKKVEQAKEEKGLLEDHYREKKLNYGERHATMGALKNKISRLASLISNLEKHIEEGRASG